MQQDDQMGKTAHSTQHPMEIVKGFFKMEIDRKKQSYGKNTCIYIYLVVCQITIKTVLDN